MATHQWYTVPITGEIGVIAAMFRETLRQTLSNNPVDAAEAEFYLCCQETREFLEDFGIDPDYFHRLVEEWQAERMKPNDAW